MDYLIILFWALLIASLCGATLLTIREVEEVAKWRTRQGAPAITSGDKTTLYVCGICYRIVAFWIVSAVIYSGVNLALCWFGVL